MRALLLKLLIFAVLVLLSDRAVFWYLKKGLDKYYGLDRPAIILCVGHSHTVLGINLNQFEKGLGVPVSMYAFTGATLEDRLAMVRHYFSVQKQLPKVVTLDVDDHTFTRQDISANSYRLFMPYIDNQEVLHHVGKYASRSEMIPRNFFKLLRFNTTTLWLSLRGHLNLHNNLKIGKLDPVTLTPDKAKTARPPIEIDKGNEALFIETITFIRSKGVKVALIGIPTAGAVNDVDRLDHNQVIAMFESYARRNPGVIFVDYNKKYEFSYDLFYDVQHLNSDGQRLITDELIRDIGQYK